MALPRKYWVFNLYSAVTVPTQNICGAGGEYRNRTDLNILLARQAATPCRPIPHIQTAVFIEVPVNDLSLNQCSSLGLALQRVAL